MGSQRQRKIDSSTERLRRPEVADYDDLRHSTEPHAILALPPAVITRLQRTIGNQAVQRLLADKGSGSFIRKPVQKTDGILPLVQRDSLTDIRVESDDFWSQVMTRVMVRYSQWINDTRQALNQFVTDMGEKNANARDDWGNVIQAWIGVAGTPGDVINAVIATGAAMLDEMPPGKKFSLADLSNIENAALQKISNKTADVTSDLPIYQTLRNKKQNEKSTSRTEYRQSVRVEVETALSQLPLPDHLRQKMVLQWIKSSSKGGETAPGKISYETTYLASQKHGTIVGELPYREIPYFEDVDRADGTVTALRGAYGRNAELHKLPVYFHVRIYGTPTGDVTFDRHLYADWVKENGTWKPRKGLGTEFSYDLFSEWLKNGRKPTTADLISAKPEDPW